MSSPRRTTSNFFSFSLAVAHALAGLEIVFVAVPRADEMHLVGERLALVGAILGDQIDDLVDQDSFAGRTAGMDAVIAVGVIGAAVVKNADLVLAGGHDAPVALGQFRCLGDKPFCHRTFPVRLTPIEPAIAGQYRWAAPKPTSTRLTDLLRPALSIGAEPLYAPSKCDRKEDHGRSANRTETAAAVPSAVL